MSEQQTAPTQAELQQYYAKRASEYEAIYAKPERQADLAAMKHAIVDTFRGRRVIEIACGTGWWSEHIASVAASLDAFDINEETLAIARTKPAPAGRARFAIGDAYAPPAAADPARPCLGSHRHPHAQSRRPA
jgi:demethylmenaquinone methyltransferase/2-methoxy-6-polyprenyl-1,4-benzoquinol methylase